jgi:hypothetical protein
MSVIQLSRGLVTQVDDADYEWLMSLGAWHAQSTNRPVTGYYAVRNDWHDEHNHSQFMHRLLCASAYTVDHINGDSLDNRRANLRPATVRQQAQNRRARRVGSSRYKGVSWRPDSHCWRAIICVDGRLISLGSSTDEEQAARAYDDAARRYFGEFAAPNFPEEVLLR